MWKGAIHGRGRLIYSTGDEYSGEFRYGKFDGKGIITYIDGGVYDGDFRDGIR